MKRKKKRVEKKHETSPVRQLEMELHVLRRELKITARAYTQRLERELVATAAALHKFAPAEELSREQLHRVRDFAIMVRQRRLRPEKGRRKDLRKIDSFPICSRFLMRMEISARVWLLSGLAAFLCGGRARLCRAKEILLV